jgi:hypothetical protein
MRTITLAAVLALLTASIRLRANVPQSPIFHPAVPTEVGSALRCR